MQVVNKKNIVDRILYYWSKLYTRQLKVGQDYSEAQKTVVILIADFEIEGLEETEYISKWKIMEEEKKIILTKKFEVDIIELTKIKGKEKEKGELLDWLYFLIDPNSERVKKVMKKNKAIEEAVEKLNTISEDEKMQRIADLREKAIMDEKATYAKGLEDGKKELEARLQDLREKAIMDEKATYAKGLEDGKKELEARLQDLREKAIMDEKATYAKGLEDGKKELEARLQDLREKAIMDEKATYAKGLDDGKEEGIKKNNKDVAKKMKNKKIDIETICEITGLSKEEIEKL